VACLLTLSSPAQIRLTATPDAGFALAGWSGDCSGDVTIWIQVNQPKWCSALFEPGIQGTTVLFVDSQPGDPIAQGLRRTYTPLDGTFEISRNFNNGVSLVIMAPDSSFRWALDFSAAGNVPLAVGSYGAISDFPWTPMNGLRVYYGGNGCSDVTGRYIVHEIVYQPDRSVRRFAADVELHCHDAAPALFAAVRYNSTIDDIAPFAGQYPLYQLSVMPPNHGRVSGGGIVCGSGGSACQITSSTATHVTLAAAPDAGYVFTGWEGDCRGAGTTSLHVNGPKTCVALFEPLVSTSPRTLLYWDSEPGDYIGQGQDAIYSTANSRWSVTSSGNGRQVLVAVADAAANWYITFAAPEGQALSVGYYGAARRSPFTMFNGIDASGSGRGCNDETGRFVPRDRSRV
jgi:Divergent InlB B-repeat domain